MHLMIYLRPQMGFEGGESFSSAGGKAWTWLAVRRHDTFDVEPMVALSSFLGYLVLASHFLCKYNYFQDAGACFWNDSVKLSECMERRTCGWKLEDRL